MTVTPIASSSKGNAFIVRHADAALLIDCGVSYKAVRTAFAALGVDEARLAETLKGVVVTHNHWDHVSGLPSLVAKLDIPIFANAMTAESVASAQKMDESAFVCFENGQTFGLGPFRISPFSIPHDATDPVGYLVRANGETYFHGTDIGTPLDSIGLKFAEADMATLESNHDPMLLKASARPVSLKQRISGPRGHLSNDDAASLVRRFASPRLRQLYLAHLSPECNAPHIAERVMREALADLKREDVVLKVILPDTVQR